MALFGTKVAVSIPDTVLEDKDSLRDKTAKLGVIARACSVYCVDVVEVFPGSGGRSEGALIRRVLQYLETPQYLRRRAFPLDESLRFAGALPPLRIPSHKAKVPLDEVHVGEFREGISNGDGTVDVGLDSTPKLRSRVPRGERVTAKIVSASPLEAVRVSKEDTGAYWGYTVEERASAEAMADQRFPLKVATSRLGAPLKDSLGHLRTTLRSSTGVKLLFGAPSNGLFEIFGKDLPKRVDAVVNLFPGQQVETVRTEEAIFAGLGLVSLVLAEKA